MQNQKGQKETALWVIFCSECGLIAKMIGFCHFLLRTEFLTDNQRNQVLQLTKNAQMANTPPHTQINEYKNQFKKALHKFEK